MSRRSKRDEDDSQTSHLHFDSFLTHFIERDLQKRPTKETYKRDLLSQRSKRDEDDSLQSFINEISRLHFDSFLSHFMCLCLVCEETDKRDISTRKETYKKGLLTR